jgi:hypothetical protein
MKRALIVLASIAVVLAPSLSALEPADSRSSCIQQPGAEARRLAEPTPACRCVDCDCLPDCRCGLFGTAISVGGPVGPDGKTEVTCDLPVSERMRNTGGRDGAGLCVFTSVQNAARYQNETRLVNFQADMKKEPGGGYPAKVDSMIAKYGKGTPYLQYEGKDPAVLRAALATGRMPSVTYNGHDPHYRGSIAHMVNLVHLDERWAVVLDNNFIGENELVWLTPDDFLQRWRGNGGGWAVVLLAPPPPPVPHP